MIDRMKGSLLGGLLLLWGALLAFRIMSAPEPQRVPLKFVSGQSVAREDVRRGAGVPAILQPMRPAAAALAFKTPKNIFAPLSDVPEQTARAPRQVKKQAGPPLPVQGPPPPTPEELAARAARQQEELAAQEAQRQAELARQQAELARQQQEQTIQQARKAMGQYRFLGYLTQAGEHRAFLGKENQIFIVQTGELVEGRIQVKAIDAAAVKLTEQTTNVETSLPLASP
jgi:type IV secretory pathway VirB10-like protein